MMQPDKKFDPEMVKNLNKNYELFGKTYLGLFERLIEKDLEKVCANTGSEPLGNDSLLMLLLNKRLLVSFPQKVIYYYDSGKDEKREELDRFSSAIALHYLNHADGTPITGEWISYRELPDGLFYSRTIPGVLAPIIEKYPSDFNGLLSSARKIGGKKEEGIKNGIRIKVFERFPVLLIYEPKDEEFDADIKILYDRAASHYLKTDIIKTLTVYLVRQIMG